MLAPVEQLIFNSEAPGLFSFIFMSSYSNITSVMFLKVLLIKKKKKKNHKIQNIWTNFFKFCLVADLDTSTYINIMDK